MENAFQLTKFLVLYLLTFWNNAQKAQTCFHWPITRFPTCILEISTCFSFKTAVLPPFLTAEVYQKDVRHVTCTYQPLLARSSWSSLIVAVASRQPSWAVLFSFFLTNFGGTSSLGHITVVPYFLHFICRLFTVPHGIYFMPWKWFRPFYGLIPLKNETCLILWKLSTRGGMCWKMWQQKWQGRKKTRKQRNLISS